MHSGEQHDPLRPTHASSALRDVEEAFESLLEPVLLVDESGRIVFSNTAALNTFGYLRDDLVGRPVEVLVPHSARHAHVRHRERFVQEASPRPMAVQQHLSAICRDGSTLRVEISLAPLHTAHGVYTTVMVQDVTERRLKEELRLLVEARERHLLMSQRVAQLGSWEVNYLTGVEHWSAGLFRLLGYEPDEVAPGSEAFRACIHPDDHAALSQYRDDAADGRSGTLELRLIPPPVRGVDDGHPARASVRWLSLTRTAVEVDNGRVIRAIGTVLDVTDRKRLERRLQASEQRFRAAFEQAPIGMALVDARPGHPPHILTANTELGRMIGLLSEQVVGRSTADLILPTPPDGVLGPLGDRRLLDAGTVDVASPTELRLAHADGSERWASVSANLIRGHDGQPDHFVTHLVDITDRRARDAADHELAARDARIAAVLQDGLMPLVPSRVGDVQIATRYQAAGTGERIGGDWADVFAMADGRIGIVIGDVAGHGVEAAATMSRLRTLVRLLATSGARPGEVVSRMNEAVHGMDLGEAIAMATLVHAQLDPGTGTLRHTSAGHLPLLVLPTTDSTQEVSAISSLGGPPVGAVQGWDYDEDTLGLAPGSALIGFTDGLIERRHQDLTANLARLVHDLATLPVHVRRDVETLADAILDLPTEPSTDDVAVVAVRYPPSPIDIAPPPPAASQLPIIPETRRPGPAERE